MKKQFFACLTLFLALFAPLVFAQQGCKETTLMKPTPFLGTANEVIVLADGSIWEDMSYKYLYLYVYMPKVIICPALGRMLLDVGGTVHTFNVVRIR